MEKQFLPVSREELLDRGWYYYDFLVVGADAYVDHPSFGTAIISRVLESEGYRVAVLAQPDWKSAEAFLAMGKPRYAVMIGGGNIDSMVAHYTAAKRRRREDLYSPGNRIGLRPDRPTIVYANRAREAFPDTPIVIGGLEASLRRFAHYDYWDDKVRRAILFDSQADLLVYGMGERQTREIAARLAGGESVGNITDVRGTAFISENGACDPDAVECPTFEEVCESKRAYAEASKIEYDEHDAVRGRTIIQKCEGRELVVNPPALPLSTQELDAVAELPYMRAAHPMYADAGGVKAIDEVLFSVTHNRGCFGACSFCSIAFHQGRVVTARSKESIIHEVEEFTKDPRFKGYVSDVGGATADMRHPSCKKQLESGMCRGRSCLAPEPCPNLDADHSDYTELLRELRGIPGVKKVFVRSGVRFDYAMCDKDDDFMKELVEHHVSGQLRVAPEHCSNRVLDYMGKPHFSAYERFAAKFEKLDEKFGKEQYLVPYLMSSHPGSTLKDAVALAEFLNRTGQHPEQVQDFYPTPGTLSTCMYYTGIDPRTMREVYVARDPHEKAMQRALLQWKRPEMRKLVIEALIKAERDDLIGYDKKCLIRPRPGDELPERRASAEKKGEKRRGDAKQPGREEKRRAEAREGKPALRPTQKRRAEEREGKPALRPWQKRRGKTNKGKKTD